MDRTLPIYAIAGEILGALRQGNRLTISAPTGSGKTTQVPQILLNDRPGGRMIILQPRRLAARLMAGRVAQEMNIPLGQKVGYRTRHDSNSGPGTQILFATEGLFLRQLQNDPVLSGVDTVILDEFHERSVAADTALALVKALQQGRRPDLRLLVMSATLEIKRLSAFLGCPAVEAGGRQFPIAVHYLARVSQESCWDLAADALAHALRSSSAGDVLIFMPGLYEIRRTIESCRAVLGQAADALLFLPLYAEMPAREQDAVVAPGPQRKVIVATNVAETSITLPGIRYVIDSGLARVSRFDPRRGINVLVLEPVSQASTQQRAGRAGRTSPGVCMRLWTEREQAQRPMAATPEIMRVDLAETLLRLLSMGVANAAQLDWLDAPHGTAVTQAESVLRMLGAINAQGRLAPLGQTMSRLPMHPRLARLLVAAGERGCLNRAALRAALISERDIVMRERWQKTIEAVSDHLPEPGADQSDLAILEAAYRLAAAADFNGPTCERLGLHAQASRQVERTARLYGQEAADTGKSGRRTGRNDDELIRLLKCLLTAFPDHLALRRSATNFSCALVGGRRGELDRQSAARTASAGSLILALDIREIAGSGEVRTVLSDASIVERSWLEEVHPDRVTKQTFTLWNEQKQAVEQTERISFDGLILEERGRGTPGADAAATLLAEQIVSGQLKLEKWDEAVEQWIERTRSLAQWFPEKKLLTYDVDDRRVILQEICQGATRYAEIKERPCLPMVRNALSWEDQRFVDQMAPERIELPGGWRMKVTYQAGSAPRGRAKIQDLYGLRSSPTIAGGRQKIVLEILAPNFRPVQMTDDLAGFWKNLYPTVKKELARKYPRHEWR